MKLGYYPSKDGLDQFDLIYLVYNGKQKVFSIKKFHILKNLMCFTMNYLENIFSSSALGFPNLGLKSKDDLKDDLCSRNFIPVSKIEKRKNHEDSLLIDASTP
jgi:hypothetical protein